MEKSAQSYLPKEEYWNKQKEIDAKVDHAVEEVDACSRMCRNIEKEFKEIKFILNGKADKAELKRFQEESKMFCQYTDLKELYSKVIPSIAKFELRI